MFRPLLAGTTDDANIHLLRFPLLASPKLDGIRVLVVDGVAVTRSLKPVKNRYVQKLLGRPQLNGFDGEVVAGDGLDPLTFRNTTTAVMAEHGEVPFTYFVFDKFDEIGEFQFRLDTVGKIINNDLDFDYLRQLKHKKIDNFQELVVYEERILAEGFEGVMLRKFDGPYKNGRSTFNEHTLLKLKRGQIQNGDAEVIGFQERMSNNNEATTNILGYTERSSHKENRAGRADLGAFLVRDVDTGFEFKIGIGVGLDDALRKLVWDNQAAYLGKVVRYEWFKYGGYDKPRFPKFVTFRDKEDMS